PQARRPTREGAAELALFRFRRRHPSRPGRRLRRRCGFPTRRLGARGMTDFLFKNAKVVTVDGRFSISEAVAVEGERISAVGRSSDLQALAHSKTMVLDLKGKTKIGRA